MDIGTKAWGDCVKNPIPNGNNAEGAATFACLQPLIQNIINVLFFFSAIVAVFFIVLGGIKLITSQGDKEKVASGQKTLTFAIAGLLLIAFAYFILNFVLNFLGVDISRVNSLPTGN
ncbi:MAG: pilin [Actinobacteria bacterium]|nr:pilin [Actinomycetota bacterium]